MHVAGRGKIVSQYHPATSQYGSHMGTCYHYPAYAEAWREGSRGPSVVVEMGSMEPHEATAKAVAILTRQRGR